MGIEGINPFLKGTNTKPGKCPEAFTRVSISELEESIIPIDTDVFLKARKSSILTREANSLTDPTQPIDLHKILKTIIKEALELSHKFLSHKIIPCWVRDGEVPKEKEKECQQRYEEKKKTYDRMNFLKETLASQNVLLRSKEDIAELRKLIPRCNSFSKQDRDAFYQALEDFGMCVIKAPGETEAYCTAMVLKGLASGVYSTDTDCYALGSPCLYTGMSGKDDEGRPMLEVVYLGIILDKLNFDQKEMRDFCIMCGCDYNERIRLIGPAKSFDQISKYRRIEDIKVTKPTDCLNVDRCRELLTPPACDLTVDDVTINLSRFKETAKECSSKYDLSNVYNKLLLIISRRITPQMWSMESTTFEEEGKIERIIVITEEVEEQAPVIPRIKETKTTNKKKVPIKLQ